VPGVAGRALRGQGVERPAEPVAERGRRQDGELAGGELDGERQAVDAADDLGHRRFVGRRQVERGIAAARVLDERPHRLRPAQRLQADDVLPGDVQRHARGGEHADAGGAGEQRGDEVARGLGDVLAVVQEQQEGPVRERAGHGLRRHVAADPQAQGGDDGVRHPRAVGDLGQRDQRRRRPALGEVGHDLDREPGLADAAGPGDGDQPLGGEQAAEVEGVPVAADERTARAGECPGGRAVRRRRLRRGCRGGRTRRRRQLAGGDALLEGRDRGPGVEAGLGRQAPAVRRGGGQRVAGPPVTGERTHEERRGPLAQGLLRGRRGRVRRHRAVARGEPGLQPVVADLEVQLPQADGLGRQRRDVGELGQRPAPPEAQRLGRGGGGGRRARPQLGRAAGGQPPQPGRVDVVRLEPQRVSGAGALEAWRGVPEMPAQPGDVAVEGAVAGVRRVAGPEGVDEGVRRHHPAAGERQQGEDGTPAVARDVDRGAGHDEAQRAQHLHP
jgi:hypothetical protein